MYATKFECGKIGFTFFELQSLQIFLCFLFCIDIYRIKRNLKIFLISIQQIMSTPLDLHLRLTTPSLRASVFLICEMGTMTSTSKDGAGDSGQQPGESSQPRAHPGEVLNESGFTSLLGEKRKMYVFFKLPTSPLPSSSLIAAILGSSLETKQIEGIAWDCLHVSVL